MSYPTLDAAMQYASLGYRVLPLKPESKIPDLRHWPEEASSDPATVRRHFATSLRRSGAKVFDAGHYPNVGIATGNGLAVVDVDIHHGGERPAWLPDTLTARTPSGGWHFYLAVSGAVPNSVGRLAPGVDVRGERGMVAAPPSRITGRTTALTDTCYTWVDANVPIARITAEQLTPRDMRQDYGGRRATFEWRDEVPVGQRNNYLTSLAGHLFATGERALDVMTELLAESGRLGFTPRSDEVASIVRSVARYH